MKVVRALLPVGLLLVACRDEPTLEMGEARSQIARSLEATYDVDVAGVRCPESVRAGEGHGFTCTVTVAGQPLTVEVEQPGGDAALRVVPTAAVLRTAEVRADLLDELASRLADPDAVADCGPATVRVVAPGRSFECRLVDGGTGRRVIVHVRDVDGSLTFQLR